MAKLKYVDRVPEPARPLPAGKTEHANDRGTRIHEAAEAYVRGGVNLVPELSKHSSSFDELRNLFKSGKASLEGEWAVDRQWSPVAWKSEDAWCRMKLDAFVQVSKTHGRVIDYKSGRVYGNEVKHTEQGQLYQLATFLKFPNLETIDVEFWYIDHGPEHDMINSYTRAQGTLYFDKYHKRGAAMTDCIDFKPNPNVYSCRWCPYNGNACKFGISKATFKRNSSTINITPTGLAASFTAKTALAKE